MWNKWWQLGRKPYLTRPGVSTNVQYMHLNKYAVGIVISLFISSKAVSDTFLQELLESELSAIEKNPRDFSNEIHVLRIFGLWDAVGAERVMDALEKVHLLKKVSPRVQSRAAFLLALSEARQGQLLKADEAVSSLGFISDWVVAGPFINEGGIGFDTVYPPETKEGQRSDVGMRGNGHEVFWRKAPSMVSHLGFLHMDALYHPITNSCFFARTAMKSDVAQKGVLRVGTGGATKVYWNGAQVLSDSKYRMSDPDRMGALVSIHKGINTLIVKVCTETQGDFGVFARLTDQRFSPLTLVSADDQMLLKTLNNWGRSEGKSLPQPAEVLDQKATGSAATASQLADAAEYQYLTGSSDLNSTETRDMAKRACIDGDDYKHCLLWSSLALDRNERHVALTKAQARSPFNLEVLISLAQWTLEGPEPAKALPIIEKALEQRPDSLEAKLLAIDLKSRRGLAKSAFKDAKVLLKEYPDVPGVIDMLAFLAENAGYRKAALAYKDAALVHNFDSVSRHDEAATLALSTGDFESLDHHIKDLLAIAPFDDGVYRGIAILQEGRQSLALAEQALRDRLLLSPRNADALIDLGLFLIRTDRREQGIETLMTANEIKPQDAWLAEYLAHLGPVMPFEKAYAIPESLFLSWRGKPEIGNESRYLVDQAVVKVYDSGLSSRFTQQVFEINNKEDAKEWRVRYIQFLPESQLVKVLSARVHHPDGSIEKVVGRGIIPISEPWYRLYYDVAAEALEFPTLSVGDVVELQYRVDDVANRNIFHDYFGDFVFINELNPKRYWRYALIAPSTRQLRFNTPTYPGLERSLETEDDDAVYTFQAENVASLHKEGDMPGLVEVASFLHISTYDSWKSLGEWYRGLVRHQMVADHRIRQKVQSLTRGKTREIDKIAAIYNWVVTATRYVGLEFGIHGYKPYKAPMVVARGFGDCKDKASLLVTMMTEAGIEAEFVLIRTNDLGTLPSEPASLAIFNHAIAYIPKFDLYLDGTAEQHGIFELPFGDQGATAVLLKKDGAKFVTTKVASPEQNTTDVTTRVDIDEKGRAKLRTKAVVKGTAAAPLRQLLEVEATRKKRFEGSLAAIYPGATLDDLQIHTISDLSKPASYTFEASVPSYADATENTIEIPVDEGLHLVREYARLPKRSYDLILGSPRSLSRTISFTLPENYVNDAPPSPIDIDTPFGSLKLKISKKGNVMTITRKLVLKAHRVSPEDYPAFVSFCHNVDAALATHIVFRRPK